jgi:uncharacterized protein (TIGR02679 family)
MAEGPLPDRLAGPDLAALWRRCFRAMARPGDWRDTTIRLPVEDDGQRHALAGLLGRPVRRGTASVGIPLAELDERLRGAGDGWDLVAVVETVGGPLPDRAGDARTRRADIDATCTQARDEAGQAWWVQPWLDELAAGMLARLHTRGELALVPLAANVLARLPADGLPLPALASSATGDTKALGGTTLEGLVLRGLALRIGEPRPETAAGRRALWEAAGVVPDDLASQVLVLGLPVLADGPLGRWLADAAEQGWPFRVTLHQLMQGPLSVDRPTPVHVCENPAVLRSAAERLGPGTAPLVCTEGRPSVACSRLLTALADTGCELRVHADFDWAGVRIAGALLTTPGARPWRMGAADYRAALTAGSGQRTALTGTAAPSPWDPGLAETMTATGLVVYEEDVLDDLLVDLAGG